MSSKSLDTALRDILHHIDLATNFSAGFDRASFKLDIKTVYAVTRCLRLFPKLRGACRMTCKRGIRLSAG
jgi:uncharacterized protein with HEPN domain